MNIITGYRGVAHITAQQDRYVNQGSYGIDSYVLPVGDKFAATIDSASSVTLSSGAVSIQGCVAVIENGQTESVEIAPGTAGSKRYDLICARYTKDATGIESVELAVVTGTPSASTPTVPAINTGRIEDGDTPVDFALFRVYVNGITIASVTRVGAVNKSIKELMTQLSSHDSSISTINSTLTTHSTAINSLNSQITQHTNSIASMGAEIDKKAYWFYFASVSDMWSKLADVPIRGVFTFRGSDVWTQDVIAGGAVATWGMGVKGGADVISILCVSGNKLHWWVIHSDGTGEGYMPLNLKQNA